MWLVESYFGFQVFLSGVRAQPGFPRHCVSSMLALTRVLSPASQRSLPSHLFPDVFLSYRPGILSPGVLYAYSLNDMLFQVLKKTSAETSLVLESFPGAKTGSPQIHRLHSPPDTMQS